MIFLSYFISITLDGQWFTQSDRMDTVGQLIEEIIENFGHVMVVIMTLFTRYQGVTQDEGSKSPGFLTKIPFLGGDSRRRG